jgi:hypothetical protein
LITPQEVKTLLDSLGTLGPIAVDSMPDSPNAIGCIYEYGGQVPERGFGVNGIKYEHPAIQIVFRGEPNDVLTPRTLAGIAWAYLPKINPGPLGAGVTTEYLQLNPQQSPFPIAPKDANNRWKIGFNVYITKVPS